MKDLNNINLYVDIVSHSYRRKNVFHRFFRRLFYGKYFNNK